MVDYVQGEAGLGALIGQEVTPGIEAGTILKELGLLQNVTGIQIGNEKREGNTIGSQDTVYKKHGRGIFAWNAEFMVQDFQFLFPVFGGHAQGGGPPFTHTLTQVNKLPSYSVELFNEDLGISRKILGNKVNQMKLELVEGEEVMASLDWIGMSGAKDVSPGTPSELTGDPWMYDECTIFSVDGQEKVDATLDMTWTYARNVEARGTLGQKNPRFVKEGKRTHLIEAELYSDDVEILDIVSGFTEFATVFKLVRQAAADEMTITFPQCKIFNHDNQLSGDDVFKEKLVIEPFADSSQVPITAIVIDAIDDYDD